MTNILDPPQLNDCNDYSQVGGGFCIVCARSRHFVLKIGPKWQPPRNKQLFSAVTSLIGLEKTGQSQVLNSRTEI